MTSPEIRRAVEGAISVKDLMEERVFSKVFFSKKAPNAKRKVTIADSSTVRDVTFNVASPVSK